MTDNLELWNRFADIDPKFTKPISGRDYGGTSPNPQYVIKCLTEMFGPVGKGFGWNVVAEDFTKLGETHLHWCRIRFWWKDDDGIHECEQYGQTKAAYVTSKGFHRVDEDAPKKSLTDAIVKAASHLGVAANIFLGRWDDQKYVASVNDDFREKEAASSGPSPILAALLSNMPTTSVEDAKAWKDKQKSEIAGLSDREFATFKDAWTLNLKSFAEQKEAA